MLRQYLKESTEFYNKEDNPMYYLFIIPKLVKADTETVKQDAVLKNLLGIIDEEIKGINIKILEKNYSPVSFMNLFQTETAKKAAADFIEQYLKQFELDVANEEKDFMSAYKVHKAFENIKNSDNYKAYIKSL
ncbi:MAG: hypothetical protein J6T10_04215 [Methanobrevibacter sp.]|nr:hypothetical protein [Methanobrevibacter sp.]